MILAVLGLVIDISGIVGQTQYRFYDALILASALESGAPKLYSEDLQDRRQFGGLRIVNPFA